MFQNQVKKMVISIYMGSLEYDPWYPCVCCIWRSYTYRWGLVPSFTKKTEKPNFFRMFNARSETVSTLSLYCTSSIYLYFSYSHYPSPGVKKIQPRFFVLDRTPHCCRISRDTSTDTTFGGCRTPRESPSRVWIIAPGWVLVITPGDLLRILK